MGGKFVALVETDGDGRTGRTMNMLRKWCFGMLTDALERRMQTMQTDLTNGRR